MCPLSCNFLGRIASPPGISLIDYPGRVAALVFFQGCNFRCPYCHNHSLITAGPGESDEDVFSRLREMRRLADALVITGGEPTWGEGLIPFIEKAAGLGYQVKLDTNGSRPGLLEELLDRSRLAYVAMDLKHTPEKYPEACGVQADLDDIRRSVEIIREKAPAYEFRTTLVPGMHTAEDVSEIIRSFSLGEGTPYFLQKYIPREGTVFPAWGLKEWQEMTAVFRPLAHIGIREDL